MSDKSNADMSRPVLRSDAARSAAIVAGWPTERTAIIRQCVADLVRWTQGDSVQFYMGERITRAEFLAAGGKP